MSGENGFIPEALRWTPPAPPQVTEETRRATQARLENFKALGMAVDADFDVDEEMKRRGLRTNAEVDAEAARAAQLAEMTERSRAVDKSIAEDAISADVDRAFGEAEARLERVAQKTLKKIAKAAKGKP